MPRNYSVGNRRSRFGWLDRNPARSRRGQQGIQLPEFSACGCRLGDSFTYLSGRYKELTDKSFIMAQGLINPYDSLPASRLLLGLACVICAHGSQTVLGWFG